MKLYTCSYAPSTLSFSAASSAISATAGLEWRASAHLSTGCVGDAIWAAYVGFSSHSNPKVSKVFRFWGYKNYKMGFGPVPSSISSLRCETCTIDSKDYTIQEGMCLNLTLRHEIKSHTTSSTSRNYSSNHTSIEIIEIRNDTGRSGR